MSRGLNSRAQNRGRKHRMTSEHRDSLSNDMETLRLELGIGNEPEPVNKEPQSDDGFGLPEVIGAFALMSLAALINVQF